MKKLVSIFGSTGSIGKNTIQVIKEKPELFKVMVLTAKSDVKGLISQARDLRPDYVVIENEKLESDLRQGLCDIKKIKILSGKSALEEVAQIKCDLFISAIVGFAGMVPTINAIRAGSNIGLANKESLVCAGKILTNLAKKHGSKIIPIDSEHNAIYQVFEGGNQKLIDNIILTASGGPFFNQDKPLNQITVEEALNHPKWKMGKKISIDSATMMNKGLEIIEAFYLFPLKKDQIKAIIHPQSVIHGMINYLDGSTLAMMSNPDMKTPISYALSYPGRLSIKHNKLDLLKVKNLEFIKIDKKKFPAIDICYRALEEGGSSPVVLNAANEVAVKRFLNGEISFDKITKIVAKALDSMSVDNVSDIGEVISFDKRARELSKNLN